MESYPTKEELKTIRDWNGTFKNLWKYITSLWTYDSFTYEDFSGEVYKLALHTGGWSGNEDIIAALRESKSLFFYMFHVEWVRGGHYYFEVPPTMWDKKFNKEQ